MVSVADHCVRCDAETGMMGHLTRLHVVGGSLTLVNDHWCCPTGCEIDPDYR